jgi:hypothetical protein
MKAGADGLRVHLRALKHPIDGEGNCSSSDESLHSESSAMMVENREGVCEAMLDVRLEGPQKLG